MTQNLALALSTGVSSTGSYTNGTTFTWAPTSCGTDGACAMNGNTNSSSGYFYYSWYAATAETDMSSVAEDDATGSICPRGFRLPANYAISPGKSFGSLTDAYGMTTSGQGNALDKVSQLESFPLNFNRAGRYWNGSAGNYVGNYGRYWSSTTALTGSNEMSYYFVYTPSSTQGGPYTSPQDRQDKAMGVTVRCVAI